MNCCDFHGIDCREGRDCPDRQSGKVWCDTSKQFCAQPYTCASACQLNTATTDAQEPDYVWPITPLGWAVLACLIAGLAFSAYYFFLKP